MDKLERANQFQEVHRQVKERLDRARDAQEKDSEVRKRKREETDREIFEGEGFGHA